MRPRRKHISKATFFNSRSALWISLNIGIIFIIVMIISLLYARSKDLSNGVRISDVITSQSIIVLLDNLLLLYFLFRFQFWAIKRSWNPRKRALAMLFGSLLLIIVFSPIMAQIELRLNIERVPSSIYVYFHFIKDMVLLVISLLFTALMMAWYQRQETMEENQKLMLENIQNRYDALKSQVDPHFLFNCLNTLNGLVGYDDEKAHEYIDQLSSVFRYTMQNKSVIQLSQELEFSESYLYLMKIRYNEGLQIEYHTNEKYMNYQILPFGLQILIENAIKHNVVSMKYPLLITIETTENETIKVRNNVQPKPESKSGGVGLSNLNERYFLMFDKLIDITHDEHFFTVEIPLIKETKNEPINTINNESCYC